MAPRPKNPVLARTERFYAWEVRLRGWSLFPDVVPLEPAYFPCEVRQVSLPSSGDDGRVPTLVERLARGAARVARFTIGAKRGEARAKGTRYVPAPPQYGALRLVAPRDFRASSSVAVRLVQTLATHGAPAALEITGTPGRIAYRLLLPQAELAHASNQVSAHYPDVALIEEEDELAETWEEALETGHLVFEVGLRHEFFRPIAEWPRDGLHPLLGLLAVMGALEEGECMTLQLLFEKATSSWAQQTADALVTADGRPFFADAPEYTAQAREKFSSPLFACVLRLAIGAKSIARALHIAEAAVRGLSSFASAEGNELIVLYPDERDLDQLDEEFLGRQTRRSGMLLSARELSLFLTPPSSSLVPALERLPRVSRPCPAICEQEGVVLGVNEHAGASAIVRLPQDLRTRHMHVIGASGTGKSTLLLQIAVQDIQAGRGIGLIDPHGDLIDRLLQFVPEDRIDDVVLVDPADPETTVGFNVLRAETDLERQLLSSDLVAMFQRLSTSWGDQMTSVLGNAIIAFLEHPRGGTLGDLRRFLVERGYRNEFLAQVQDAEVRYYWEKEFPLLSGRPQAPLLTRLDTFLRPRLVREMVNQHESTFNVRELMDRGGILLVRLSQGAIGEENAALLASMFVAKIQQAAQSRQDLEERDRRDFMLYLDEFHNYITPSMAGILSGARKYRLGLVLAHQELGQIKSRSESVLSAAISNPAVRVCFRLGDGDAKKMADGFAHFDAGDLQSLGVGEAICRVQQADQDFNLRTSAAIEGDEGRSRADSVRVRSAARFGVERSALRADHELTVARPTGPKTAPRPDAPEEVTPAEPARAPASATRTERVEPPVPESSRPDELPAQPGEPEDGPTGRGGPEHRMWAQRFRQLAIEHGCKARIEAQLEDGLGFVDVLIETGKQRIGVEIGSTTSAEHELVNVQKCLQADLDVVVVVCCQSRTLARLNSLIGKRIPPQEAERVSVQTPEGGLSRVNELIRDMRRGDTSVLGFKVRTTGPSGVPETSDSEIVELVRRLFR